MNIGKAIKTSREKLGFSNADLVRLTFLDKSTISNYEAGRRMPSIENLEVIANALKMKTYELVFLAEHGNENKCRAYHDALVSAEQTLRNLGNGFLKGDAQEIALNASYFISVILDD